MSATHLGSPMIRFSTVAHDLMREQTQYGYRYLEGVCESPELGQGLRFKTSLGSYHDTWIHPDDVAEFIFRYAHHRANEWCIGFDDADVMLEKALAWSPSADDFE